MQAELALLLWGQALLPGAQRSWEPSESQDQNPPPHIVTPFNSCNKPYAPVLNRINLKMEEPPGASGGSAPVENQQLKGAVCEVRARRGTHKRLSGKRGMSGSLSSSHCSVQMLLQLLSILGCREVCAPTWGSCSSE